MGQTFTRRNFIKSAAGIFVPTLLLPRKSLASYFYSTAGGVASELYYVDPSAAGSSEVGTQANPYLSLMNCLDARANKTFTLPIFAECSTSGSTPDTERVNIGALGQMVTSGTNYLQIRSGSGHRPGTSWDATKYNLSCAFASGAGAGVCIANDKSYVYVDGLQISISSHAGQDASAEIIYTGENTGNHNTCRYSNLLIKGQRDSGAGGITRGMSIIYGVTAWNLIIYDCGSAAGTSPIKNHGSSKFYSCTFISHGSGAIITADFSNDGDGNGTTILKNCYAGGATFHDYDVGSGTVTMTNCGSSDTTADGTAPQTSKAVNTTQFTNVTAGSQNWALPSGSALENTGVDTTSDAAPLNFTDDIAGTARSGTWDIGADGR